MKMYFLYPIKLKNERFFDVFLNLLQLKQRKKLDYKAKILSEFFYFSVRSFTRAALEELILGKSRENPSFFS